MPSLYLKNLNALRAIAAFMVIIHHIEQFKTHFNLPNIWSNQIIRELGGNAVSIFFVLSGFLISYLLVHEKRKTSSVSIKKFYVRRVLRIWPLYFILILLGIILNYYYGDINLIKNNLFYFLLFVPNLLVAQGTVIMFISHLWSIGVEEQFYLFWPLASKKLNTKQFFLFMLAIIFVFLLARNYTFHFYGKNALLKFIDYTRFDMMAIGGIGALILTEKNSFSLFIKYIINQKIIQFLIIIAFILYFLNLTDIYRIYFLNNLFFGILITLLLLVLVSKESILNLEHPIFKTLGNISYGIYMYHSIVIFFSLKLVLLFVPISNTFLFNLCLYSSVFMASSIISYISYEKIEKPFLKLKSKFIVIK